jgi:hypothetical protein
MVTSSVGGTGVISPNGQFTLRNKAPYDGKPTNFSGAFSGNAGTGRFQHTGSNCTGAFTAQRSKD